MYEFEFENKLNSEEILVVMLEDLIFQDYFDLNTGPNPSKHPADGQPA